MTNHHPLCASHALDHHQPDPGPEATYKCDCQCLYWHPKKSLTRVMSEARQIQKNYGYSRKSSVRIAIDREEFRTRPCAFCDYGH